VIGRAAARGDGPAIRLPDPALLFEGRAARLRALAAGHAAGDWLSLLGRVAEGQHAAVREVPVRPARAAGEGPPLAFASTPRDESWRRMLGVTLPAATGNLPLETREAIRRLADSGVTDLESLADGVLAGRVPRDRLACAPFVGAALQAWFASLAATLDPSALSLGGGGCPVCGAAPVAGVVQGDDRRRWLTCSLCAAEWNVPRLRCTTCGLEEELGYFHLEGEAGAEAEACGACRVYLKLFDEEKRPGAEPAADDAATLALDLLMGEGDWRRAGVNLQLVSAET